MRHDLRRAHGEWEMRSSKFQVSPSVVQVELSVEQRVRRTCYDLVDRDGLTFSTKIPDGEKVARKGNYWTREAMDTAQKEDHQIDRALIGSCSSPSKSQRHDGEKNDEKGVDLIRNSS